MALIIEDGTEVDGANSFATAEQIVDFAAARGVVVDPLLADVYAIKAMDYIASLEPRMKGYRTTETQDLCYPRQGVIIRGCSYFPDDEIPVELINGQCALAMSASLGVDLMPTVIPGSSGAIKREKVGPLETEYFGSGSGSSQPTLTYANSVLQPLLNSGAFRVTVDRA